jgi:short-subunit dehydrogenase
MVGPLLRRDIAQQYAERGARVVVVARSENRLQELKDSLVAKGIPEASVQIVTADLSTEPAAQSVIDKVGSRHGGERKCGTQG